MPESWITPDIVCPYFASESKKHHNIICEGPEPGTTAHICFARDVERLRWLQRHCTKFNYQSCPICKMAAEKYEER